MRMLQQGPTTPDLRLEDVLNIRDRYSPQKRGGEVRWVVLGGGAVKFLLEAEQVTGRAIARPDIADSRDHKDLDIYCFGNENLRGLATLPLEVFGVDNQGPLRRLDYRKMGIPKFAFFVEVGRGYNFGFQLPSQTDVTEVTIDNEQVYTVSPEFAIASRLFDTRGVRIEDGLGDEEDAKRLFERFDIDLDDLYRLRLATPFSILPSNVTENLELLLNKGVFRRIVSDCVRARYESSDVSVGELEHNALVSLLDYSPDELKDDIDPEHLSRLVELTDDNTGLNYETVLGIRYIIRPLAHDFVDTALINHEIGHRRDSNRVLKLVNSTKWEPNKLWLCSQTGQLMKQMRALAEAAKFGDVDDILIDVGRSVFETRYHNVQLAMLEHGFQEVRKADDQPQAFRDYVENLYERKLIGE